MGQLPAVTIPLDPKPTTCLVCGHITEPVWKPVTWGGQSLNVPTYHPHRCRIDLDAGTSGAAA